MFRRLTESVNKTIVKTRVVAAVGRKTIFKTTPRCSDQYVYVGFSQSKILHSMAITIAEKAIQFRHPDYNPDRDQKLISSSTSRHLSTRNISSKSMNAFLSNLVNGQTDRQTDRQTPLPPPLSEVKKLRTKSSSFSVIQTLHYCISLTDIKNVHKKKQILED